MVDGTVWIMLREDIGFVCGACDGFSPVVAQRCVHCGEPLLPETGVHAAPPQAPSAQEEEEPMEQARNYVCKECLSPVPSGHKFCGGCGAAVPPEMMEKRTDYFAPLQAPGKARLTLVRADQDMEGMTLYLHGDEHVVGRSQGELLFPRDPWVSPRHANFLYRDGKLFVHDEGSVNGVYLRIRKPVQLKPGDHFLCGEQVFRLDAPAQDQSPAQPDGTHFYASPHQPEQFRVAQVLVGGIDGMVVADREGRIEIGREECDMNFPEDIYLSARHAVVRSENGQVLLEDAGSRNGTYVRISGEAEINDGDYVFIGRQLIRVEVTG